MTSLTFEKVITTKDKEAILCNNFHVLERFHVYQIDFINFILFIYLFIFKLRRPN